MQFVLDIRLRERSAESLRAAKLRHGDAQDHALAGVARAHAHRDQTAAVAEHVVAHRRVFVAPGLRKFERWKHLLIRRDMHAPVRLRRVGERADEADRERAAHAGIVPHARVRKSMLA